MFTYLLFAKIDYVSWRITGVDKALSLLNNTANYLI